MRHQLFILGLLLSSAIFAQQYTISGRITEDSNTKEALIGANVTYGDGYGTIADIDGNYLLKLPAGEYKLTFSYVGYTPVNKVINLNKDITLDVQLTSSTIMKELMVVADVAIARETPVAFSTLTPKTLAENLASQDIPMVLNSTPGVYATNEGGGDGDAQVTIRGFSSRNVGVLLDGVPVNDMESGHVYWSNWFGLDAVTRSMQVQRGLGASKLALPSVGGTINIITKGMDSKKGGTFKQEVGSDGYLRSSFGYNTGKLNNGWAFSAAGSYKRSNGWVDQLWSEGYFWYGKIDKRIGNHTISLSAYGAPQQHAQRSYKLPLAAFDSAYAEEQGVKLAYNPNMSSADSSEVGANRGKAIWGVGRGVRFNQHWGYLNESLSGSEPMNERINQYHKPQITLKDSWSLNDNLFISNIFYVSIGNGGGVRSKSTPGLDIMHGQMDFQTQYDGNNNEDAIDGLYDDNLRGTSSNYMRRLVNSHRWYGLLSTANYEKGKMTYSGGVDLRYYRGIHYEEIYDLLGADYVKKPNDEILPDELANIDWTKPNPMSSYKLGKGDITNFHNDGFVRWGGLFFQPEYKADKLSAFINLTAAVSSYNRIDYFADVDPNKPIKETGWNNFPGFTVKSGANYNINDNMNAFANLGFLDKAPRFNNVYDYDNTVFRDIENEKVTAGELGFSYHAPVFSANLNSYYTVWQNRPVDGGSTISQISPTTGELEDLSVNINGMGAIHKGIELDFVLNASRELSFQGLVSFGDWRWNSSDSARVYNDNQELVKTVFFDAKGVHVGNSAQTQVAGEVRWEPIPFLYFKPRVTFFTRYYSEFDPMSLNGSANSYEWYDEETGEHGDPRDSWMIPSYALVDFHAGYSHKIQDVILSIRFNMLNVLNKTYIATAQNNDSYNGTTLQDFDAKSASVFMGMGRRFNVSLGVKF